MSEESQKPDQLEGGAYEVIRARLDKHAATLRDGLDALNAGRLQVFGGIETALLGTERVSTDHNCVAGDLVAVGKRRFLFGYNIQFGLKHTTDIRDVFAAYDYDPESRAFTPLAVEEVLGDRRFTEDFAYLFEYYREAVFQKVLIIGPHLNMAMRIGKTPDDINASKWRFNSDGTLEYLGNRFDHEYVFPDHLA